MAAPIPAMVSSIATSVGKAVKKGEKIAVLEAVRRCKQHFMHLPTAVKDEILVQVGDSVESKDLIARLR